MWVFTPGAPQVDLQCEKLRTLSCWLCQEEGRLTTVKYTQDILHSKGLLFGGKDFTGALSHLKESDLYHFSPIQPSCMPNGKEKAKKSM